MKRFLQVVFVLLTSLCISKPYIQLSFHDKSEMPFVAEGYALYSVTDSERFYIYFSEAFRVIFKEVKFQDLFTSENVLKGTFEEAEYNLVVNVNDFSLKTFKRRRLYLKDDENGDYILVDGNYIRVYAGRWYRYDYKGDRFILDNENGMYVKGIDGRYYYYMGDFYRKIPVDEVWASVYIDVDYKLYHGKEEIVSGTFKRNREKRLIYYTYDGLNNKLLKHIEDKNVWLSEIAKEFSEKLLRDLKRNFLIEASVLDLKDMIVIIDKGKEDGVKPGMVFEGKGNIFVVRETAKHLAEAEIMRLSNVSLKSVKILNEDQNFSPPLLSCLGTGFSTLQGFYVSLGVKAIDLHWKEKASADCFISYNPFENKVDYGVDFRMVLYAGFFAGFSTSYERGLYLYAGYRLFNFNPYLIVSTDGFVGLGGDISW